MKGRNLLLLAGAAILLLSFTRKKKRRGSVEIGPLTSNQLKAAAGAQLMQTPDGEVPIYTFQGGEWLSLIKEYQNDCLVEFVNPAGSRLRGLVAKEDIKKIA